MAGNDFGGSDEREPQGAGGGDATGRPATSSGVRVDVRELPARTIPGFLALASAVLAVAVAIWLFVRAADTDNAWYGLGGLLLLIVGLLIGSGVVVVSPGETKVLVFFGRYAGTVRRPGLHFAGPFMVGPKVSVKVRNFETQELKVNDADGNPVNIAAIIVWQVDDTAKAVFAVDRYADFVQVQAESALRHVASVHPYDRPDGGSETSLRGSTDQIAAELAAEVAARISIAGLEVVEARIASLAYAPEIAHAMLQRQQAAAVIAAREKIVEGAVSMVEGALRRLEATDIVNLDEERKAAMVSNLLVVLCSSSQATPVVNTGTLYT